MSTAKHGLQEGQRVTIVDDPPGARRQFAGLTGIYLWDTRDGRPMVLLDTSGAAYSFDADRLAAEPYVTLEERVVTLEERVRTLEARLDQS